MHKIVLDGQSLRWYGNEPIVASDSINQVVFEIVRSAEWENMALTAQFSQLGKTYSVMVQNDRVTMPSEITAGTLQISVFSTSSAPVTRYTVTPLLLTVHPSGFVPDGVSPIPPTPDLYAQWVALVEEERKKAETAAQTAKSHAEQTGEDRIATGEDRVATGADRSAVNTALLGFAETTLPDAIQAVEDKADTEIARVGQAGDTQVQAVNAAGAEQIGLATAQADLAEQQAVIATEKAREASGSAAAALASEQAAKGSEDWARTYAEDAENFAGDAEEQAQIAANNILNGVSTHNSDTDAHQSIQSDIRTVAAALQQVGSQLADIAKYGEPAALWRTAIGNPAQFYPVPGSKLYPKISLIATQTGEGDPSPENVRPIVPAMRAGDVLGLGRTGKNLIDWESILTQFSTHAEVTRSISGNTITLSGTPTAVYRQIQVSNILISPSIRGKSATLSANISGNQPALVLRQFNKSKVKITEINMTGTGAAQITISPDTAYLQIILCLNKQTTGTAFMASYGAVQLELGSAATPYEPYAGDTYEFIAPQDIYGLPGAETYVDWEKGELVVGDALKVFNGTENWLKHNTIDNAFYIDGLIGGTVIDNTQSNFALCSAAQQIRYNAVTIIANGQFAIGTTSNVLRTVFCNTACETLDDWKDYLAAQKAAGTPVAVLYQLATPIRIPLTDLPAIPALPQLDRYTPRQNVLTVDKGVLTVGYAKSPIRESDELAAAIAALS